MRAKTAKAKTNAHTQGRRHRQRQPTTPLPTDHHSQTQRRARTGARGKDDDRLMSFPFSLQALTYSVVSVVCSSSDKASRRLTSHLDCHGRVRTSRPQSPETLPTSFSANSRIACRFTGSHLFQRKHRAPPIPTSIPPRSKVQATPKESLGTERSQRYF